MNSVKLRVDTEFDERFMEYERILENLLATGIDGEGKFTYDAACRLMNEDGLGLSFIIKLYAIGFINGIRAERKRRNLTKPIQALKLKGIEKWVRITEFENKKGVSQNERV